MDALKILLVCLLFLPLNLKAEGEQVSGPPSVQCPMGMVWAQVSLGEYQFAFICAPSDILDRKEVKIQIEGRPVVNCRVLAVKGK